VNQFTNQSKFSVWLLAARPKTLPAAAAPVIVGVAVAFFEGFFQLVPAIATLLAALLLQIGANLANDVFDFRRGADTTDRLGPIRVTQAGYLTPSQVLVGMWIVFGLAVALGIYLITVAGWLLLLIGLASILTAIAYTGGPFPLGYYGFGDLAVFLFFGLVAVCGTYYVQAGSVSGLAIWSSFPMGFLISAILVVNNLRDIETDRAAGKRTLAVRLGPTGSSWEYLLLLLGTYLTPVAIIVFDLVPGWISLAYLSLPFGVYLIRQIWCLRGKPLNRLLAQTGQLTLGYALLFSLGLAISAI